MNIFVASVCAGPLQAGTSPSLLLLIHYIRLLCRRFGVCAVLLGRLTVLFSMIVTIYGNSDFDLFISRLFFSLFHGVHVQAIGRLPISSFVADFVASLLSVDRRSLCWVSCWSARRP